MTQALGLALALLVGISLGALGSGGSILTVPILVYVLGIDAKTAIAMSLPIVGAAALAGAARHLRAGTVRGRTALPFGAVAMLGALAGARAAVLLSGRAQLLLLAAAMLAAAGAMFRGAGAATPGTDGPPRRGPLVLGAAALGVGALTGLVGIGGGFLIVPALVLFAGLPMAEAAGTSLVVIAMNSLAGAIGYLGHTPIPWGLTAAFTGMAMLGILAGMRLAAKLPQTGLRRGFAVFLVLVGCFILYRNRSALTPAPTGQAAPAAGTPR